jgi:hypothetical protein
VSSPLQATAGIQFRNIRAGSDDAIIMKLRRVTGSLFLAAGLASGVFAAPAQAQPDGNVDTVGNVGDILSTLDLEGLTGIDPGQAVAIGQSLCPMLADRGQTTADIAAQFSEAIGRPLGPSTMFTGAAISFLCPRAVENVTNNLVDGKPLLPLFGG